MKLSFFIVVCCYLLACNTVQKPENHLVLTQPISKSASIINLENLDTPVTKNSFFSHLEWPFVAENDQIIQHKAYALCYDEKHEQAKWVAYVLTAAETISRYERTNDFNTDPAVKTGSASNDDYKGSGYDRGHLAPAGDMGFSSVSMIESFYYSNMSPQNPSFNRGIWKKLEEQVRSWAVLYDSVLVVTGPVLTANLPKIGVNGVSIPSFYYKVILDYKNNQSKAIALILPNVKGTKPLSSYVLSIDELEKLTNLDFFPELQDDLEARLEKNSSVNSWDWKIIALHSSAKKSANSSGNSNASQCSGTTKKGLRCKKRTNNSSGKCYLHE
jgi:endonuclease G